VATELSTAIDIGGTKIAAARIAGDRVVERHQIATPRSGVFADMVDAIAGLVPADWRDGRIGIATTGMVRAGRLTALNPTTLPIPDDSPLEQALSEALGVPAQAFNDAHAAAWAEYELGAGRGATTMAFLTVSTGVGGGVVDHGRLQVGADGFAGHLGHLQVALGGEPCGCGRSGCVEAISSGTALARIGSRVLGRPIDAGALIALAETDADAARVVDVAVEALVALITNLRADNGIDCLVLGGSVGLNPAFFQRVSAQVAHLRQIFRPALRSAELGHDAGLVGAARLVAR